MNIREAIYVEKDAVNKVEKVNKEKFKSAYIPPAGAKPLLYKENPALRSLWCKTAEAHTSGQTFNY